MSNNLLSRSFIIKMDYLTLLNNERLKSGCKDKKVACLILSKDLNIIGIGHNTVTDCLGDCAKCAVKHAEEEATRFIRKGFISIQTLFPCENCQRLLYNKNIQYIYYIDKTKNDLGLIKSISIDEVV